MMSPIRNFRTVGAVTLAIGVAAGAVFIASAHDGSPLEQDICTTTGVAATAEVPFLAENDAAMKKIRADNQYGSRHHPREE
jgi:hypothetical protein